MPHNGHLTWESRYAHFNFTDTENTSNRKLLSAFYFGIPIILESFPARTVVLSSKQHRKRKPDGTTCSYCTSYINEQENQQGITLPCVDMDRLSDDVGPLHGVGKDGMRFLRH